MKVIKKQRNSKMCIMCGLDNEYGVRAPFYTMEDGSVATLFSYREQHQSYPGRVHGGLITAMLDEMGLRALWATELDEKTFGVTISLETKFRKPVPYGVELLGRGRIVKDTGNFLTADTQILDRDGQTLASGIIKYIKLDPQKIQKGVVTHEELCYLTDDNVTEIDI